MQYVIKYMKAFFLFVGFPGMLFFNVPAFLDYPAPSEAEKQMIWSTGQNRIHFFRKTRTSEIRSLPNRYFAINN